MKAEERRSAERKADKKAQVWAWPERRARERLWGRVGLRARCLLSAALNEADPAWAGGQGPLGDRVLWAVYTEVDRPLVRAGGALADVLQDAAWGRVDARRTAGAHVRERVWGALHVGGGAPPQGQVGDAVRFQVLDPARSGAARSGGRS